MGGGDRVEDEVEPVGEGLEVRIFRQNKVARAQTACVRFFLLGGAEDRHVGIHGGGKLDGHVAEPA